MYRFGIRTLIVGLAFAGGLLGLLAGGLVLVEFRRNEERAIQAMLLETARAFALAVDQEFATIEQQLTLLAQFDPLDTPDFVSLSRSSAGVIAEGGWIALADANGRQVFNTLQASAADSKREAVGIVQDIVATRRPAISDVFISPTAGQAVITVGIPVIRNGEIRYVLMMSLPAAHFAAVLRRSDLPRGWLAVIVDRSGAMAARSPSPLEKPGRTPPSDLIGTIRQADEATYKHVDFDGVPLDGAFARSKHCGWAAGVGVPTTMLEAPFRRSMIELGLVAGLLVLTGLVFALRLGRRVACSVASLSRAAEALGCGDAPLRPDLGVREIEQAGAALLDAAQLVMRRSAERDRAIESLRHANEGLEERVNERTSDLAAANRKLSQETQHRRQAEEALSQQRKIEAIGQLTAGIAHDFNNLLTAVIGNLEMLLPRLDDERTKKLGADALSAAGRGARLTRQLLAFGRKQQLETRVIDVNELIAGAGPLLDQAVGPFVDLELRLAKQGAAVAIDPAQMELALLNLAINARDAMPEGGRLLIETQRLNVSSGHPDIAAGEWAVIAVTDTGVGMSPEVVARAFDPFFTTKGAGAGSGLGLSMVYGLVKQLGGDVAIVSEVGKGTSVKIYLRPVADAPARPASALPARANDPSKATVLVVDDDPAVLGFMADVLSEAGHQVVEASSGAVALEMFGAGDSFQAVVLDYAMPGMDGIATARAMRARRRDMAILLVTGFAAGVPPGDWPAANILHKPFGLESLQQRVESLIRRPRRRKPR